MAKRVLLLEPKEHEGSELAEQIEAAGDYHVNRARNLREACTILAGQPQDLALLPVTRNDSLVYSLRFLQPELPMFLLVADDEQVISPRQQEVIRGIIKRQDVIESLPTLLTADESEAAAPHFSSPPEERRDRNGHGRSHPPQSEVDLDKLTLIVQNAMLDHRLRLVVLVRGDEVIGYHTTADDAQITAVAQQIRRTWDSRARTAQIQFSDDTDDGEALLLFTRLMLDGYLLTLGAYAYTPVSQLRAAAEKIVNQLAGRETAVFKAPPTQSKPEKARTHAYAIIWQSQRPMPAEIRDALRDLLPSIAQAYGCVLNHLIVETTYVHFVALCPPKRTTAWIARTFKQQAEQILQRQFDVAGPFWADGYYARESAEPLSEAERDLFLDV